MPQNQTTPAPEEELPPVQMSNIPPANRKLVLRAQLPVVAAELLLTGLMLLVYALLGKLTEKVVFGAILGCGSILLYFLLLLLSLLYAEKKSSPAAAQLTVRLFYLARTAVLVAVLVLALRSSVFDPLSTVLPLCFYRLALFVSELLTRKGGTAS